MKEDKTYNGWTNYETWNVNLWLDNDPGSQEDVRMFANGHDNIRAKCEMLKEYVEEMNPLNDGASMFHDLLRSALDNVNWKEIIENHIEEEE